MANDLKAVIPSKIKNINMQHMLNSIRITLISDYRLQAAMDIRAYSIVQRIDSARFDQSRSTLRGIV
jgi:hypothetical protein